MPNANHAADAVAIDADAFRAVIVVDAVSAEPPQLAVAVAIAAEPHALATNAVEFPPVAADSVSDTVARAFDAEYAPAVSAAANGCVEPEQPVLGPGHERSARAP